MEVVYVVAKRKSVRITPRWLRISLMYQHFSRDWSHLCDYSRQAQEDAFLFDSLGQKPPPRDLRNGFILGKQWMGVTVDMWKEDLRKGLLFRHELYEDPNYPHWWLDQVLTPE